MTILSIQSHVAYGHVGNDAAVFPLQRLGIEVWPVHTVQFSSHTGYGVPKGRVFDGAMIRDVVTGIEARGVFGQCAGVLSGYIGSAEIGEAILDAVARVKRANPAALYCCDPVIGDVGRGVFVREGVADFMAQRALPLADIITPNHFELDHLSGRETRTLDAARGAIKELHARGPRTILVTSLQTEGTPAGHVDIVVSESGTAFRVRTPRVPMNANGAGDLIAALFLAHYLRTGSAVEALSKAASSVHGVLSRTAAAGAQEMLLVEAQEEFTAPGTLFEAEAIG